MCHECLLLVLNIKWLQGLYDTNVWWICLSHSKDMLYSPTFMTQLVYCGTAQRVFGFTFRIIKECACQINLPQ